MTRSETLRIRLGLGPTLIVPDAFDPLSARLIERAGFEAVQCSGYSMAAAQAYPAETNLSYSEALETTRRIVNAVTVPVMADGEDGFGDRAKLQQAVGEFIGVGAAGMNIEDQVLGRWGAPRSVVDAGELVEKLAVARAASVAAGNPAFVLNARTDALNTAADRTKGLDESVRRANRYLKAGADLTFVTGVRTMDEARYLAERIEGPLSLAAGMPYNTDTLPVSELVALGIARVSLPFLLAGAAIDGMAQALAGLGANGGLGPEERETVRRGAEVLEAAVPSGP
jgi:2-methylisocitrate lyase-like PEP mutase family enzyme